MEHGNNILTFILLPFQLDIVKSNGELKNHSILVKSLIVTECQDVIPRSEDAAVSVDDDIGRSGRGEGDGEDHEEVMISDVTCPLQPPYQGEDVYLNTIVNSPL